VERFLERTYTEAHALADEMDPKRKGPALCALLTGMHPGRSKHGRGSKHQACIDALRATGENGPRKTGVV
jgi:hypothetical protein